MCVPIFDRGDTVLDDPVKSSFFTFGQWRVRLVEDPYVGDRKLIGACRGSHQYLISSDTSIQNRLKRTNANNVAVLSVQL